MSKRDSVYIPLTIAFKVLYNLADFIEEKKKANKPYELQKEAFNDLVYLLYPYTETGAFRVIPKID
jgi:hypothetical protein